MQTNEHGEPILNGNESPRAFANALARVLEEGFGSVFAGDPNPVRFYVENSRQPYITVRHPNGAEWQITPVRSGWPMDGTSEQFDPHHGDDEDEYETEYSFG